MNKWTIAKSLLLVTTALPAGPLWAQGEQGAIPGEQRKDVSAPTASVNAGLDVVAGHDDNVYAVRNREQDDGYLLLLPFIDGSLRSGEAELTLRGSGEVGRYADLTSEDYDDWRLGADGRATLMSGLSLVSGAEWRWDHESRASPEAVSGLAPTQYDRVLATSA